MKNFNYESYRIDPFNTDTLKDGPDKSKYETVLTDYDLERQIFRTRAHPQSETCLDHLIF